jgi:hypothetical protein
MDNRYNQLLWRKILLKSLEELKVDCDDDIRVDGLGIRMVKLAEEAGVFDETFSLEDKKRIAYACIMKELIAIERNTGLEGLGLIKIIPVKIGGLSTLFCAIFIRSFLLGHILLESYS